MNTLTAPPAGSGGSAASAVPVAVLLSHPTGRPARTGRVARDGWCEGTVCAYSGGSSTEAYPIAGPAADHRDADHLLRLILPTATTFEDSHVLVDSRVRPAAMAADGVRRAFVLQLGNWVVAAVVPDRPGEGTAPHLHLIHPARDGRRVGGVR